MISGGNVSGMLMAMVIGATVVCLPICMVLLWIYRRAVKREMTASAGVARPAQLPPGGRVAAPLQVQQVKAEDVSVVQGAKDHTLAAPWRAALVQVLAGLAYAAVMMTGWTLAAGGEVLAITRLMILFWIFLWPAVLSVMMVVAPGRMRWMQVFGAYFAVFVLIATYSTIINPQLGAFDLPVLWIIINAPSTVLVWLFLWRRIRAVGLLVLIITFALAAGSQFLVQLIAMSDTLLEAVAGIGFSLGFDATGVLGLLALLGMIASLFLVWPLLKVLARAYRRKRFSDLSMQLTALWLLFALVQPIGFLQDAPLFAATGLLAFTLHALVVRALTRRIVGLPKAPQTLLLLRVFALTDRAERFFDAFRRHWQHAGSIVLIAGPDLATSTIEPHEFLDFLGGRLSRSFITSAADLERRVSGIDLQPDPDGRYRINEFFCREDTWQAAVKRLANESDAVLMDLRSFSAANQGCVYELGCLIDEVGLEQVVFLVDATTDEVFLTETLQSLWQRMAAGSPNRRQTPAPARLFFAEGRSETHLRAMLMLLMRHG